MSDSSIPSVRPDGDRDESGPEGGGSSANSLGAPAPDPDETENPDETRSPDRDVHGDPEQVS